MLSVKALLDKFYGEYDFKERILHDPIEFPHRYKRREDIEIAGFIASCFAYGKVTLFKPVIEKVLSAMSGSPYDFLMEFKARKDGRLFSGIKYRFNENKDVICLLYILRTVVKKYGSIEALFKLYYKDNDLNTGNGLIGFVDTLLAIGLSHPPLNPLPSMEGKEKEYLPSMEGAIKKDFPSPGGRGQGGGGGLLQFFPSPSKGSACKRMNLFLRWMIRKRDIDFGIWKGIPENKLIIPLDTHIAKISRCLGFTKRRSQDWKMAVEITNALKKLDPEDPLKYDFAMCHYGIAGLCSSKDDIKDGRCRKCLLKKGVQFRQ